MIDAQPPRFITVFNTNDGVHEILEVSFLLAIAPLYKKSEVLDDVVPVKGFTVITNKAREGTVTNHTMQEFHDLLGSKMPGTEVPLIDIPSRSPGLKLASAMDDPAIKEAKDIMDKGAKKRLSDPPIKD